MKALVRGREGGGWGVGGGGEGCAECGSCKGGGVDGELALVEFDAVLLPFRC